MAITVVYSDLNPRDKNHKVAKQHQDSQELYNTLATLNYCFPSFAWLLKTHLYG